ncbi:hypothetical protein RhiirC2_849642 [Rhizophagus irregularis]|uniref:F-box domain-containing protein n=1 Tax=Rhizophagus irregularis TaxID=588596 RepID=A0A2N1NAF6_9GLOM|nr:hypothetical protein RhiirC2_849642 [Rhizophagus irregularis]
MMLQLDEDVLFLILKEFKNDKKSLYSCLLVNRTWCVITVPILWRNPEIFTLFEEAKNILFNVILLHLSEESRNILKSHGVNSIITETYQQPSFNYISFWKHLDLFFIENLISRRIIEEYKISIVRNELLKTFFNKSTKLIHLSIPQNFDYQLHLIQGAENCFSKLESFNCYVDIDQNILEGLARICKSIKKLKFIYINSKSLAKHADTVKYLKIGWKPTIRFLSYFLNLLSLEFVTLYFENSNDENYLLEKLSLPHLKILKVGEVPIDILIKLIESVTGNLLEISVLINGNNSRRFIQSICKNCPNLKYFKLSLNSYSNSLISEFKNLLINCQYLDGLIINICEPHNEFNWDKLFEILTQSSSINLFKFKFSSYGKIKLEHLKLFFDNWKDRNPILLKIGINIFTVSLEEELQLVELIKKYEVKGIIKKYSVCQVGYNLGYSAKWI